jgi:AcrR family transcriptional regulator
VANIGTQARGRDRRRLLVESAIDLFSSTGYRGTGIAAVATAAGVTGATLLHHFGSKEGLLQAVLEERDRQTLGEWEAMVAPGGIQAIRNLVQVARSWKAAPGLPRLHAVLLAESIDPEAPMHDYFVQRQRWLRKSLQHAVTRGIESGEVRADVEPRAIAAEEAAFLDGAIVQWALDPRRTAVEDLFVQFTERLAAAIAAPAGD